MGWGVVCVIPNLQRSGRSILGASTASRAGRFHLREKGGGDFVVLAHLDSTYSGRILDRLCSPLRAEVRHRSSVVVSSIALVAISVGELLQL